MISSSRRKEIEALLEKAVLAHLDFDAWCRRNGHQTPEESGFHQAIRDLLAAEKFWREAVRNATSGVWYGVLDHDAAFSDCPFCQNEAFLGVSDSVNHKPGCAWLLAHKEAAKESK